MSAELLEPSLEFVFELRVAVDDAVRIGRTDSEDLNFTPITGGRSKAPRCRAGFWRAGVTGGSPAGARRSWMPTT